MTERCRYCKESFGLHLLTCPLNVRTVASARASTPKPAPRRQGSVPRDVYLNAVSVTAEHERTVANERQRRYRERNREAINAARRTGRPMGRPKKSA